MVFSTDQGQSLEKISLCIGVLTRSRTRVMYTYLTSSRHEVTVIPSAHFILSHLELEEQIMSKQIEGVDTVSLFAQAGETGSLLQTRKNRVTIVTLRQLLMQLGHRRSALTSHSV